MGQDGITLRMTAQDFSCFYFQTSVQAEPMNKSIAHTVVHVAAVCLVLAQMLAISWLQDDRLATRRVLREAYVAVTEAVTLCASASEHPTQAREQ